ALGGALAAKVLGGTADHQALPVVAKETPIARLPQRPGAQPAPLRGLLARALGKTIEQGFLGYDRQRLVIRCSTENLRSQRAAERQGFRRDGVIRANEIIAGRAHDHAIYTLLRSVPFAS
ncbi:GNAT family N-acetyltransferase, partial [Pseudomonas aeruginosa]